MVTSRRVRWVGHVPHRGERNTNFWDLNLKEAPVQGVPSSVLKDHETEENIRTQQKGCRAIDE
jgi:hypothetical protein